MDQDPDRLTTPEPHRNVRDYLWGLVERHGEDYVREGVRLLKMFQVASVLLGLGVLVAAVAVLVWLVR